MQILIGCEKAQYLLPMLARSSGPSAVPHEFNTQKTHSRQHLLSLLLPLKMSLGFR
jgi:hypothetical protein